MRPSCKKRFALALVCLFFLAAQALPGLAASKGRKAERPALAPSQEAPAPEPTAPSLAAPSPGQQVLQPEAAFTLMAAEAERGNANAMLTLARFYEQGVGVARNYSKSLEWCEKAAKAGLAEGYYNLGICFEIGMGTPADAARAVSHYQQAADRGLALAMYKLSSAYILGKGVSKDADKGIGYLEKAAEAGMAVAANDLGVIALSGLLGREKNVEYALSSFKQAASLGNLEAMKNIAVTYKDGVGVQADPLRAYAWYLIAQRSGYAGEDIARMLGLLEGSLSADDLRKARKEADAWAAGQARI